MLETDEVDIDYFTPAGSTSLANIFGKSSVLDGTKDNPSLKYVSPPLPEKSKPEEVKPTQWIFTCAVHGFEWLNSGYISRGKLGLAILKIVSTNSHSIILYDSNKTTLSYVIISPNLKIHVRDVSTISYYDNGQKYWSIQTSEKDINKMLQLLKDLQATVLLKTFQETDKEQADNNKIHNKDDVAIKDEILEQEHEIDTDFFYNQKTKDSILKRMANMGHSVLPHGKSKGCSSDSSDSNDIDDTDRHKLSKLPPKRCTELNVIRNEANIACHSKNSAHKLHIDKQKLDPSKSTTTMPQDGDLKVFISEQRASNSELRINVNEMSDKIDVVLQRLNNVNLDNSNSFSSFQNDIVQKLMKEYESKIKNYEDVMNSKGIDFCTMKSLDKAHLNENITDSSKNYVTYINQINKLEKECIEKNQVIRELEKEIKILNENNVKITKNNKEKINELAMEIEKLKENLSLKNEEIDTVKKAFDNVNVSNQENLDIANKVKKIMNNTFETISVNFEDNVAYSGETVKSIIGIVIKKTTIQALQEL